MRWYASVSLDLKRTGGEGEVLTLALQCNRICQHDPFLSAFQLRFDSLILLCPGLADKMRNAG